MRRLGKPLPRRHVPSSIDRLGPEIVAEITRLRIDHGWTIDEILEKLRAMGAKVSRSAVGRHIRSLPEVVHRMKETRMMAETVVRELGGKTDDTVADANIELAQSLLMRATMAQENGEDGPVEVKYTPEELLFLARTAQALAGATKSNADRRRKDREEAKKEIVASVEEAAKKPGSGLTADAVLAIRQAVLGMQA